MSCKEKSNINDTKSPNLTGDFLLKTLIIKIILYSVDQYLNVCYNCYIKNNLHMETLY